MAQIANFVGKERKPQVEFITEAGTYRLKIVKHEVDGYTQEGNEKNKYTFEANKVVMKDGKPALSEQVYTISGIYNFDERQEWVFMNLADAIKIQTAFDPADLIGYYVMADVKMEEHNGKMYAKLDPYSYKYSKMNDSLPPVPEAKVAEEAVVLDDDEEMPF